MMKLSIWFLRIYKPVMSCWFIKKGMPTLTPKNTMELFLQRYFNHSDFHQVPKLFFVQISGNSGTIMSWKNLDDRSSSCCCFRWCSLGMDWTEIQLFTFFKKLNCQLNTWKMNFTCWQLAWSFTASLNRKVMIWWGFFQADSTSSRAGMHWCWEPEKTSSYRNLTI